MASLILKHGSLNMLSFHDFAAVHDYCRAKVLKASLHADLGERHRKIEKE